MERKAYKFRIYPNEEQKLFFAKTFGCVRFIYNKMLSDRIDYYNEHQKKLHNTPANYKKEYEWLKEVDSLALANAAIHLDTAYNNFFRDPKIGFPKYKSKRNSKKTYTTNNQKGTIYIEKEMIRLPKIGKIKMKQHRKINEKEKIKSVTVSLNGKGEYYVSILVEYENQVPNININKVIGLDYGMHELYVDSNGTVADYPKYFYQKEKRLKREQRRLSRMKKGSNNYEKQRKKLSSIHIKIANQRKDFLHKLSRKIERENDAVCIEDLDMLEMSKKYGKTVSDNGWRMFITFLEYKLRNVGKKLIKVNRYFESSQICFICGYKNKEIKDLSIRKWECPECKAFHDRDINAARNIKQEGIRKMLFTI